MSHDRQAVLRAVGKKAGGTRAHGGDFGEDAPQVGRFAGVGDDPGLGAVTARLLDERRRAEPVAEAGQFGDEKNEFPMAALMEKSRGVPGGRLRVGVDARQRHALVRATDDHAGPSAGGEPPLHRLGGVKKQPRPGIGQRVEALDYRGSNVDGDGIVQYNAAGNFSWNLQWTFMHNLPQLMPPAGVVSQGTSITSSSIDTNYYNCKANNGVYGDRWAASSNSLPQWWRVDTGIVQQFTKVAIDWNTDSSNPTYQYKIEVSDNDSNWTVAADRTNNSVTGTTVDRLSTTGRFLRVTVTGAPTNYSASFKECRVYNETQPMRNLSQFRP